METFEIRGSYLHVYFKTWQEYNYIVDCDQSFDSYISILYLVQHMFHR